MVCVVFLFYNMFLQHVYSFFEAVRNHRLFFCNLSLSEYLILYKKFGFVGVFDFAQSDSVLVGTGLPDGPQITLT